MHPCLATAYWLDSSIRSAEVSVRAEIGQQVEEYLSEGGKIDVLDLKPDIKGYRQAFWSASSEYFSLPPAEIT